MELRHLRYFIAVAEEQNVTRAAARLHISQPPLSRQMRELEDELGIELFTRTARSLKLTEAGKLLLTEARATMARLEEALQAVRAVGSGERGKLRVGYAPSLTVELLPAALRVFQEARAAIRVTLHDLSTEEMLAGLSDESLDVALMPQPDRTPAGLGFEKLRTYSVCLALSPVHALAGAKRIALRALGSERFLGYSREGYPEYHEWLQRQFAPLKQSVEVAEEYDSATSLIAALEAGRGVAMVPACLSCIAGPRLLFRAVQPRLAPIVVGVASRKKARDPQAELFLTAARAAAGEKARLARCGD